MLAGGRCVFRWFKKTRTDDTKRPETAVFRFDNIDPVKPSPKFGNSGPPGWGFILWGSPDGEEFMYRYLLETFAKQNPHACLTLPEWYDGEDLIEGALTWRSQDIWVWYETVLSHIWLWSADEEAIESLRTALLPLAKGG
jgi:hypothetical protein